MLVFANPLGLLALVAVPAILLVHFLQRESRRVTISTLFLLESLPLESARGRRFQALRHSVPLYLQLLAALLAAWLLAQPRWRRPDSTQRIAFVLDSSLSMNAFRPELQQVLATESAALERLAAVTEWQLLETDLTQPALYTGTDRARLLEAAARWQPRLGTHDFQPALQLARASLRAGGLLILATDRPAPLTDGAHLLAVGRPLENCGFTGATFTGRHWEVLVRNYGHEPQQRSWWSEARGQKSAAATLALEPGQSRLLSGDLPEGLGALELFLTPDAFTLDDRLPLVLPQPKPLTFAIGPGSPLDDFLQRLASSFHAALPVTAKPDLLLTSYDPLSPAWPAGNAIVLTTEPPGENPWLQGDLVTEAGPLTEGLNFAGLLAHRTLPAPPHPGDETLLWQGERSLIFLRPDPERHKAALVVNFDVRSSNAAHLPSFILLLHRFAEQLRAAKVAPESANVELNQALALATDPALPPPPGPQPSRAPAAPAFFEIAQGARPLLYGAAQFADAREADFQEASSGNDLAAVKAELRESHTQADFLAPLWLMLLTGAVAGNWCWRAR